MKRILFLGLLFKLSFANIAHLVVNPDNSVFVFDLHGVVLKYNSDFVWNGLKNHPQRMKLVQRLGAWGVNKLTNKSPQDICIENAVIKPLDDSEYISATLKIINPFEPNQESIKLIKQLHDKGFKIFACSNIGEKSLQKLKDDYPELKDLFENYFSGFQIPNKKNRFITKMNLETYRSCRYMIKTKLGKVPQHILFVDDSVKKIRVAESFSVFKGIEFKSVDQFKNLLRQKKVI